MRRIFKQIIPNIISGTLIILPLVTTLYVFFFLFQKADSALPFLFHSIIPSLPKEWVPGVGFVLIIIVAYFAGVAAKNYIGKKFIELGNAIIANIPLINKVYLGIQQILDAVAGQKKKLFDRPVLIEYPKEGSYCIGFVTSNTKGEIPRRVGRDLVSIFVPTTPNPTSGFLLFIPEEKVINLDMGIENAVKLVMSAGVVSIEELKDTQHMYKIPKSLKNWNFIRHFKKDRDKRIHPDPRD